MSKNIAFLDQKMGVYVRNSLLKGPWEVLQFQNSILDALLSSKVVLDLNLEGK